MVILGGMGKLHGAVIGAFAYTVLQEILSTPLLLGSYAKHWQLAMGSLIVFIVLAFPHGLAGILDLSLRSRSTKPRLEEAASD
jgi:branched-chain amino acid transport system permease protein